MIGSTCALDRVLECVESCQVHSVLADCGPVGVIQLKKWAKVEIGLG